jgi:hypothetical protein
VDVEWDWADGGDEVAEQGMVGERVVVVHAFRGVEFGAHHVEVGEG